MELENFRKSFLKSFKNCLNEKKSMRQNHNQFLWALETIFRTLADI